MAMAKSQSSGFVALLLFSLVLGFRVNGMVNDGRDTKVDPSSVLKTIVSGDEIIDCVDIYKQPAFNYPLLQNHTLQLKLSSHPTGSKSIVSINSTKLTQMWHRNGEYCPKRTVPILRSPTADLPPKNKYDRLRTAFSNTNANGVPHPEFAIAFVQGPDLYGLNADMSVWNPKVEANESSSSQVWVSTTGEGQIIESIEAGWMVTPSKPHPKIFIYWTIDGYLATGCYNLDCPGFVLTSHKYSLGSQVQPISTYGGQQYFLKFKIFKDVISGNWWLNIQGANVGYWPVELFTNLGTYAELLEWGGRVMINTDPEGIHTTTQMGSGHFPSEGYGKAAWFSHLQYVDQHGSFNNITSVGSRATRRECYDVQVQDLGTDRSASFLYGGPG